MCYFSYALPPAQTLDTTHGGCNIQTAACLVSIQGACATLLLLQLPRVPMLPISTKAEHMHALKGLALPCVSHSGEIAGSRQSILTQYCRSSQTQVVLSPINSPATPAEPMAESRFSSISPSYFNVVNIVRKSLSPRPPGKVVHDRPISFISLHQHVALSYNHNT